MDVEIRPALSQDRQDEAWKAGAGAEVGPGQGVWGDLEKLGGVPRVARPEVGQGCGADQVHHGVPLHQPEPELFHIGQLSRVGLGEMGKPDGIHAWRRDARGGVRRRVGGHERARLSGRLV